jgi:peptidoglycan/LPS O-acetylase OafA/YrhL
MKKSFNHWLDFCRALAIILVLLSHGRHFLLPTFPQLNSLKFGGFLGVELFFVLSGFLIGKIILEKIKHSCPPTDWVVGFWCRRWLRTYPSYLLFLCVNLILLFNIRPDLSPSIVKYLTFTQSLISAHPSFFGEAWSLAVEEIFYLLTPIIFSVLMWLSGNKDLSLKIAIIALITIPLALRTYAAFNSHLSFNEIRTISLFRIDSITYGVLAILYLKKHGSNFLNKTGLLLLPICIYIAAKDDSYINNNTFLKIFLFPAANIGFACLICTGLNVVFNRYISSIFSNIARWSYAAYLTNLPALFLINKIMPPPLTYTECISQWIMFIALTLISAYIIYSSFEKKILRIRDKLIAS